MFGGEGELKETKVMKLVLMIAIYWSREFISAATSLCSSF